VERAKGAIGTATLSAAMANARLARVLRWRGVLMHCFILGLFSEGAV